MFALSNDGDGDTRRGDGGDEYYYFAARDGSFQDNPLHLDPDCGDLERAPHGSSPVRTEAVDEDSAEWCPACSSSMGGTYQPPDPDTIEITEPSRGQYQLHLPGDVRLRFDAVVDEGGFYELYQNREVIGSVGNLEAWPRSARKTFKKLI